MRLRLQALRKRLGLSRSTSSRTHRLAIRRAQQLSNLKQIRLKRVHKTGRLSVLGARADRDRLVLDDVADTEAVGGCRAEAEVS